MANIRDLGTNYCPVCGLPVAKAQAVAVPDGTIATLLRGSYERQNGHSIVEDSEVRLYQHGDGEGSA